MRIQFSHFTGIVHSKTEECGTCEKSKPSIQKNLDQHKSSNLIDNNYNIPLGNLEGLPPEPPLLKKFNKSCFSFVDFLQILSLCRNASGPDLNGIPYKVYKKCPKIGKFFSKFFKLVLKGVKFPFNGEALKRFTSPKLALLRTNCQTFAQWPF